MTKELPKLNRIESLWVSSLRAKQEKTAKTISDLKIQPESS